MHVTEGESASEPLKFAARDVNAAKPTSAAVKSDETPSVGKEDKEDIETSSLIPNLALRVAAATIKYEDEQRLLHNAAL